MEETVTPYELPETENHSFFYVDRQLEPRIEAGLHSHDAWEVCYVVRGRGYRTAGDTSQPFAAGDAALIPPGMPHRWAYDPASADERGRIRYLMVAFDRRLVERCTTLFPELRNRLTGIAFPTEALKFGPESTRIVRCILSQMSASDELERLCAMLRLLPVVFTAADRTLAGRPMRLERDVRRMQRICTYVMAHYGHAIPLDAIAAEAGMNRTAFCAFFKRYKGMTFSQFLTRYRLDTACELLKHTQKQVSEICYAVGFNDLPHFVRVFTHAEGISPSKYRKRYR